jgi:prolyl oligopeptidase
MDDTEDPYLWLEEVHGDAALAWVRERNAHTRAVLEATPGFGALRDELCAILDSREQIPYVSRRGAWLYNLWRDAAHPRGLWRRTTLGEYRKAEPAWHTLIDLDALARDEGENWVWGGASGLGPGYTRWLVSLSRGGADASVLREFDSSTMQFVEGGFDLPEAKSDAVWQDIDHIYVATDFGTGSLTVSGYPRIVKRWRRGQALADADTVFEAEARDVAAYVSVDRTPGFERTVLGRVLDMFSTRCGLLVGASQLPIPKPDDATISFWREQVLVELRSDWAVCGRVWPRGSLLVGDAAAFMGGAMQFEALFTPTATRSLAGCTHTRTRLLLNVLDNVASRLEEWQRVEGRWQRREIAAPFPGTLSVDAWCDPQVKDDDLAETYALNYTDFLTPDSLMLGHSGSDARETLKTRPAFFDAMGMRVEQHVASSKDCTPVPYFVVWPAGARCDGRNPTLLYGYGGFEVSQQPLYSAAFGAAWHRRGGVRVVANIRGGGEFGPGWHQAAIKGRKQNSYDDFAAVAEDLIARRITSPRHLGIQGGSNGGLLVGAVMLQRPELFRCVVCQVPLLDMKRYHRLLAGASWMAEYGDPDDAHEWGFIGAYSPYQNLSRAQRLPKLLFTTSTRDDRVHPGHARKMAARMLELGHEALYYENIEGGHGGAADNAQRADMMALEFSFLWQQLAD